VGSRPLRSDGMNMVQNTGDATGTMWTCTFWNTGVTIEHLNFDGRARHNDFLQARNFDGNGHGSHVAGTLSPIIIVYISHLYLCYRAHLFIVSSNADVSCSFRVCDCYSISILGTVGGAYGIAKKANIISVRF
jgi:subtilisin family serine protease